jgi:hypothetical protein
MGADTTVLLADTSALHYQQNPPLAIDMVMARKRIEKNLTGVKQHGKCLFQKMKGL